MLEIPVRQFTNWSQLVCGAESGGRLFSPGVVHHFGCERISRLGSHRAALWQQVAAAAKQVVTQHDRFRRQASYLA